ncbi:MAG: glutamine-synthetase adenylyltransferase [Sphingomonadaceae bacterium]|nr:glutamine-synthetase adenylyltransferase [Sphingomonadaceae bacterium]
MIPDRLPAAPPAPLPPELSETLAGASEPLARAAAHAWTHSPFLRALMRRRPAAFAALAGAGAEPVVNAAIAATLGGEGPCGQRLRRARADVALATALADIAGLWPLERVTRALSGFADAGLDAAVTQAIAERTPGAPPRGLAILALGKLGSFELNYSSDVDLIVLFDRATLPVRPRADPDEEAVRLTRRVMELMQGRDADGYVARVDLRLRPSPEATPIAIPVSAAIEYYHAQALPWERAAFIRARACAGDRAMGEAFLHEIAPFVWRRSLDFQAIREVQSISLRIRDAFEGDRPVGGGFDLKKGRGGIREIEFYAQMHQMIWGGREPALRVPATLDALAALAEAGRIAAEDAVTMARAYRYLRAAEHRAQMVDDAQTHAVPDQPDARQSYARFSGYAGWDAMAADLVAVTATVAPIFDRVGERPAPPAAAAQLPREAAPLIAAWRNGERRALRSDAARSAYAEIEPALLAALADSADPQGAVARFDRFLGALTAGAGFFALLAANPALVGLLGRLLTATPVMADALARSPYLFDILLDPQTLTVLPSAEALRADLALRAARARGEEDLLEAVRRGVAERRFLFGAKLLEGLADPLAAARAYSDLADAALGVLAPGVEASFAAVHGRVAGAGLIVLAMGRWGGRMLTARSDLDLVFLHNAPADAVSDGSKPLAATTYFTRLAQRLSSALSVPTASGALYEVDTRLRPSGNKGQLVPSVEAFLRYGREEAWPVEHLALTRARVVLGDPDAGAQLIERIATLLTVPRDVARLKADTIALRAEIARAKPPAGPLDVKLAPGGLVDLELLVQVRQLEEGMRPEADLGTAITALTDAGRLPDGLFAAHQLLTRVLVLARLVFAETHGPVPTPGSPAVAFIARRAGLDDARALRASIEDAMARVRAGWGAVFGSRREG